MQIVFIDKLRIFPTTSIIARQTNVVENDLIAEYLSWLDMTLKASHYQFLDVLKYCITNVKLKYLYKMCI